MSAAADIVALRREPGPKQWSAVVRSSVQRRGSASPISLSTHFEIRHPLSTHSTRPVNDRDDGVRTRRQRPPGEEVVLRRAFPVELSVAAASVRLTVDEDSEEAIVGVRRNPDEALD